MAAWEVVTSPPVHYCDLPDPKRFAEGTVIRCTERTCFQEWRRGVTWFWRDPKWREYFGNTW
jgi:hypothetical protein